MRCALILPLCLALAAGVLSAQHRPVKTESPDTVPSHDIVVETGVEVLRGAVYPLSGLRGNLARIGMLSARIGAGDSVEIEIFGTAQDILWVEDRFAAPYTAKLQFSGDTTHDAGDFSFATKLRFLEPKDRKPGIGFRLGCQLPNASNESGLGIDETNAFGSVLLEERLGTVRVIGNVGIAILGDPISPATQDDLLTYGIALLCPVNSTFDLFVDFNGRSGHGSVGTEDQSEFRAGTQVHALGLIWDIGGFAGFKDTDPDAGIVFGVSKRFHW